jgi:hypothetical protein
MGSEARGRAFHAEMIERPALFNVRCPAVFEQSSCGFIENLFFSYIKKKKKRGVL